MADRFRDVLTNGCAVYGRDGHHGVTRICIFAFRRLDLTRLRVALGREGYAWYRYVLVLGSLRPSGVRWDCYECPFPSGLGIFGDLMGGLQMSGLFLANGLIGRVRGAGFLYQVLTAILMAIFGD